MKQNPFSKIKTVIGLALCVIFLFLLICNVTIIIKGTVHPEIPPSVFGVTPMVVLSGSMSGTEDGHIEVGDLIFDTAPELDDLQVGDVVSFMDGKTVVTHRIVSFQTSEEGIAQVITKGDANNVEDAPIAKSDIIGIYRFRIPKLGDFALFLQQPLGMAVFIGIPVCAFIIWNVLRRNRERRKQSEETERLKAELAALKADDKPENPV